MQAAQWLLVPISSDCFLENHKNHFACANLMPRGTALPSLDTSLSPGQHWQALRLHVLKLTLLMRSGHAAEQMQGSRKAQARASSLSLARAPDLRAL